MATDLEFSFRAGGTAGGRPIPADTPLRIGILGDFCGTPAGPGEAEIARRRLFRIDEDTFDSVIARVSPRLDLTVGDGPGGHVAISFAALEDFHPDPLYDRLDLFRELRDLRARLRTPSTFPAAAAELAILTGGSEPAEAPARGSAPEAETDAPLGSVLDQLLGKSAHGPSQAPTAREGAGVVDALLRAAVESHITPSADPRLDDCVAKVEALATERMRAILHHPSFQALESIWRGTELLVTGIETDDPRIEIDLISVSKEELIAGLNGADSHGRSWIGRLLTEQSGAGAGETPWGLLLGVYAFAGTPDEVAALGKAAETASGLRAPFVAATGAPAVALGPGPGNADEWLSFYASLAANLEPLRQCAQSAYLGLAAPRFLARLPYGRRTDRVERFGFEELSAPVRSGQLLWANPAFLVGYLLGQAYAEELWGFTAAGAGEVEGLPYHVFEEDGEPVVTPPAEAWLPDRAIDEIGSYGFTAVQSIRGRDAVRVLIRSLCRGTSALAGRWCG